MDQATHSQPEDDKEPSAVLGLRDAVVMLISNARQKAKQGFILVFVIILLLLTAAFIYGSFYYSYMPVASFSTPVHYYYRTDCESPGSFVCSYPMANISLMRNKKPVLTVGQAYQMSLQLEMPDSPANHEMGMFMIKTTCFSRSGARVASSARSARQQLSTSSSRFSMLRYRSEQLRYLGTLLLLPALLTGVSEQKQVLEVELFSDFRDDPYASSTTAFIEILSSKVQIYSSQLHIHAHFTGMRYLLFNFPLLSALVGVSSNFLFLSVIFVLFYVRLLLKVDWGAEQIRTEGLLSDSDRNTHNNQEEEEDEAVADDPHTSEPSINTEEQNRRVHLHTTRKETEAA
ncbi:Seipin [Liparis tanakae]|uniref:Seipin n=1 Tax=Liparis tanakae TaxID=230148 RepID=A0A4Z2FGU4_9TELE|nr:Seipin [Liparis tanakae]